MEGFIRFIGTGGARVVASSQVRSTGGLWLGYRGTNVYIDPGPGALVRLHDAGDHLRPADLDGIILTHKHLDHANDVNIMIEAMAQAGRAKKGVLFCTGDAIGEDGVVFRYVRKYLEEIELLREKGEYRVKNITFSVPVRHVHSVEAYGLIFHLNKTIGLIADTRFFDELPDCYPVDILIANVLRVEPIGKEDPIDHLSVADFRRIITRIRPEVSIMTHFGATMIKDNPDLIAEALRAETGLDVKAAHDGMVWDF
ncbi:MAG: MBL fold metallo-hydrolase [Syntrophorhabdales bacterium]|jgi:ribonuclease BN (tRNA processing enzyme)